MQRTNFKMEYSDITMIKGDTVAFNAQVFDADGEPVTIDSAYFTCKKKPASTEIIFQKSFGDGISQTDGYINVRIAPEDTREVEAGNYFYDFQIGSGQDIFTILIGSLIIEQDVT